MLFVSELVLERLRLLLKGLAQGADLRKRKLRCGGFHSFRTNRQFRQRSEVSKLTGCVYVHRCVFQRKIPVFIGNANFV